MRRQQVWLRSLRREASPLHVQRIKSRESSRQAKEEATRRIDRVGQFRNLGCQQLLSKRVYALACNDQHI